VLFVEQQLHGAHPRCSAKHNHKLRAADVPGNARVHPAPPEFNQKKIEAEVS